MEQINRIEIRGVVGNVQISEINDSRMAKFSVATNYAYKNRDGVAVIETTWHNVTAFEGREIQGLDRLAKGAKVDVVGRVRVQRYVGQDGVDRSYTDIQAAHVTIIGGNDQLSCEF